MATWLIMVIVAILLVGAGLWITYKITSFITKLIMWAISFLIFAGLVGYLLFKYGILRF